MRTFITRISLFLLPLLAITGLLEFSMKQIPNDYSNKRRYLDSNSNNIEIIFLGSSHTFFGINPKFITGVAFNASHVSQSIDYDYAILKKYENNWEKLECIILPIDYFTMFSRLSTGIEAWREKNYILYYDINKNSNLTENSELFTLGLSNTLKRIYSYYFDITSSVSCSKLGFGKKILKAKNLELSGIIAAKRHTILDENCFELNLKILQELIEFATKNNMKILFYTSPAYHTYVSNLNKTQLKMTINLINELVKNNSNCYYYNLLEDDSFDEQDYSDADHLNEIGAKKLSLKLNDIINEIK